MSPSLKIINAVDDPARYELILKINKYQRPGEGQDRLAGLAEGAFGKASQTI
ncbi:hypothetical protein [Frankia nepalensis]|uniref:Uncharacterized protein n=1 Tax=Frankia nepalensis TaxID=1836974 RepID=A0A937RFM6_9ACTN|nr:hypothetical protein [Frankia nepalensis]MBL7513093.1 hypothetical protein [Frankia nepalensis]MBL7628105.1 hypothetical protein [Frankia nepalensis]